MAVNHHVAAVIGVIFAVDAGAGIGLHRGAAIGALPIIIVAVHCQLQLVIAAQGGIAVIALEEIDRCGRRLLWRRRRKIAGRRTLLRSLLGALLLWTRLLGLRLLLLGNNLLRTAQRHRARRRLDHGRGSRRH